MNVDVLLCIIVVDIEQQNNLVLYAYTDNIKKWWLWEFWISPAMYGQNALLNNEFQGKTWRHVCYSLINIFIYVPLYHTN